MGLFDILKKKPNNLKYANMLRNTAPMFAQFGENVYASDVVQSAINCIVQEMKKLNPTHVRTLDGDDVLQNSALQKLLNKPNEKMTTSEFIERVIWTLYLNYNAFIVPTYIVKPDGSRTYTGLYPIQPRQVDFLQDVSGMLYVNFKFSNDYESTVRYSDVIHIKYKYAVNEFMGGNDNGQPDNGALLKTLQLNECLIDGVNKAMKSSFAINGVIKYNTLLDAGKMDEAIHELETHLKNNESGILPLDLKGEFIPLQNKIQMVDSTTLKFIDEKILRYYGVPLCILSGDFTKAQYEAFYQKTLEPLIISLEQAFSKVLFTENETAFGNKIVFNSHELIFMTTEQKIQLFDILVDSGSCFKNEMRVAFGLKPLKELEGQIATSSNKQNAENNGGGTVPQKKEEEIN